MILFFDGVSSRGYIAIFSSKREQIASENFQISGNESTKTTAVIDGFLKKQNITYREIDHIVSVVGPGSFTGIRTVSLVINTLSYIYPHITLTAVNFFDMYEHYPVIKASSKRDLFVKYEKSATIEIVTNDDFVSACAQKEIYGDINDERFEQKYVILSEIHYLEFIKNLDFESKSRVAPMYIKKPNIS